MIPYNKVARLFEEQAKDIDFYQNSEVLSIKASLEELLDNNRKQLVFLVGEPGVGKSAFLNNFDTLFASKYDIIKFDMPFFEPVDFIKTLILKSQQEVKEFHLEGLIQQVIEIYKDAHYIVLMDEAQLLSNQMIEVIRILADSKAFWFILAMHKHESKKILQAPQFATRPHKVLELGVLQKHEYESFIYAQLTKVEKQYLAQELVDKYLKSIYTLTHGNFRNLKKLLFHLFLLLHFAHEHKKIKYQKLSKCLLLMSAIDGGIIDA
jgi:replication-associated recombination protein RarA